MLEAQIQGYRFALDTQNFWMPIMLEDAEQAFALAYHDFKGIAPEKAKIGTFYENMAKGEHFTPIYFAAFKRGVLDSRRIFIDDDHSDGTLLDVDAIVRATGFNRSYIKAELKAGRLSGMKEGREWRIAVDDYMRWYQSPQRGKSQRKE